jgi:AraC-like DNA-binding protein
MAKASGDFSAFRFSTDDLPERDRMAIWHEVFGRQIVKVQFQALPETRFFHTTMFRRMPGLSLAFVECSGFDSERTRQLIGDDGSDDLVLAINTGGLAYASQFGRETPLEGFDAALLASADVCAVRYPASARYTLITVPREAIISMAKNPEAIAGQRLRNDNEALRLLTHYVSAVDNGFSLETPELRYLFTAHVQDLLALVIGATREGTELAQGRGLRAARLAAIKSEILTNLTSPALSAESVGAAQGISADYVRRLLASEGRSFTDFVLEQRLLRAHRALSNGAGRSISEIAFGCGFGDLSYFNRAFRRRFDETPSDMRGRTQLGQLYSDDGKNFS